MFCVMWCVIVSKSAEPHAAKLIQRLFVRQSGAGTLADSPPIGTLRLRAEFSATKAHATATHAYAHDHPLP